MREDAPPGRQPQCRTQFVAAVLGKSTRRFCSGKSPDDIRTECFCNHVCVRQRWMVSVLDDWIDRCRHGATLTSGSAVAYVGATLSAVVAPTRS